MSATLTAPPIASTPPAEDGLDDRLYRLSVHQYEEMTRLGILTENDKVELLEGLIVTKMKRSRPHIVVTGLFLDTFIHRLPDHWHVSKEDPIALIDSEPEPDVSIVRGGIRDYIEAFPTPAAVLLVIEVADATLHFDRTLKKRIYARSSIPIYWLVSLNDRRVEVYEDPTGPCDAPDYRKTKILNEKEMLTFVLDGQEVVRIQISELLTS